MSKDIKLLCGFSLIFLINTLAMYIHNRFNAFLYIVLLAIYILLNCPAKRLDLPAALRKLFFNFNTKQAVLSWVFCVFTPIFFALYYLNFKLLLLNFALNILLAGGIWWLKNKEMI